MSERDFLLGVTKVERLTKNVDSTSPWVWSPGPNKKREVSVGEGEQ